MMTAVLSALTHGLYGIAGALTGTGASQPAAFSGHHDPVEMSRKKKSRLIAGISAEIGSDRLGHRDAVQFLLRHQPRGNNFTIIEPQLG
jgi:hypothetical protein